MERRSLLIGYLFFVGLIFFSSCKEELPEDHFNLNNKIQLQSTSLSVGGNAINVGMDLVNYNDKLYEETGFCWSIEETPTIEDNVSQVEVVGDTLAILLIDELKPSTKYYVRGYAIYEGAPIYSNQLEVKTNEGLPVVATADITTIGSTEATGGGEVLSNGDFDITARGVCWSLMDEPTIDDSITVDSTGLGKYVSLLTNLVMDTTYYVRAYATNSVGTNYGSIKSFRTLRYSSVTTASVTNITSLSAISGGIIADDGDFEILSRGVCWSTAPNPTTNDDTTNNGTGKGSFSSLMTNLTFNTTYYVRAYLTNREGVIYGEQRMFTTLDGLPEITTGDTSSITDTTALCGGTVVSNGGYEIIEQGICWNTIGEPTVDDNKTIDASGLETFTNELTGLTGETTYYVRAYAINIAGKAYGEVKTFTTALSNKGTLVDIDGNVYKWVRIGEQTWMAENLKVASYPNGDPIPIIENDSTWDTLAFDVMNFKGLCYPDYDELNKEIYGAIYSYNLAMAVCPTGWHLPSKEEWEELKAYVGNNGHSGSEAIALKDSTVWTFSSGYAGIDKFKFKALPGGHINSNGSEFYYGYLNERGTWWTSSKRFTETAFHAYMHYNRETLSISDFPISSGYSVRCVKDE